MISKNPIDLPIWNGGNGAQLRGFALVSNGLGVLGHLLPRQRESTSRETLCVTDIKHCIYNDSKAPRPFRDRRKLSPEKEIAIRELPFHTRGPQSPRT